MKYITSFLILCLCYYTISYGVFLKKKQNNRLGAFGAYLLAIFTAVVSISVVFTRF
ncbi:hypothetical protein KM800_07570 [Clostridium tyrobutyricum]|uniref:hypothetical protein n=1 Tax=Clostridium tyrobutyricum TaxID=1519 RepID=UPI001C3828F5|nr:hypothetical protein [Clostridium tyrobutyricum]MBV4419189.1 hypothetical protein [Clostridium tyrobutyricum]